MKQTHNNEFDINRLTDLLSAKKLLEEKTRINLYVPKIIVRLIDYLAKDTSRGELVTNLVVKEIRKNKKIPYGMFSGVEISDREIDKMTSRLQKKVNELT